MTLRAQSRARRVVLASTALPVAVQKTAALTASEGEILALLPESLQQEPLQRCGVLEEIGLPCDVQDVLVGQIVEARGDRR
jgi:hypothetical protein